MTREMRPFGDEAALFPVPETIGARRTLLDRLRGLAGIRDVVLCETEGCVVFDAVAAADRGRVTTLVEQEIAAVAAAPDEGPAAREVRVPVVYDGEDLAVVAATIGAPQEEVVRRHEAAEYVVTMLGFLPGFAYLRGLPATLHLPRRAPRPRVPAYSVAIGAEYTGIYPVASAGGWHLLGRALELPRLEIGDRVRFEATAPEAARAPAAPTSAPIALRSSDRPRLVVTRLAGLALFVDGGRRGQMHWGMPPGGPLVREAFASANRAVGGGCAVEVTGMIEVEARGGAVRVCTDGASAVTLREGERRTTASGARRVGYLAIEGGFEAPIVEGSRGALLAAGIGRPLRRGDVLLAGGSSGERARMGERAGEQARTSDEDVVVVRPGPELDEEDGLRSAIERGSFTISSASNRSGTRLEGPPLEPASARASGGRRPSTPMVEGAIELTPSGLIVLGPDHPTTGGYPVVAVVAAESRDAFFARPLGAAVRFRVRPA